MEVAEICANITDWISSFFPAPIAMRTMGKRGSHQKKMQEGQSTQHSSPDCLPHVEPIQRLCAVGAPARQADKSGQPVGDVDQLMADGSGFFQKRACDKSHSPHASLPQRQLPPTQRPVAAATHRLTSVIWQKKLDIWLEDKQLPALNPVVLCRRIHTPLTFHRLC